MTVRLTDAEAMEEAEIDPMACGELSPDDQWICTRPEGHSGEHIACCKSAVPTPEDPDEVVARWFAEDGGECDHGKRENEECATCEHDRYSDGISDRERI